MTCVSVPFSKLNEHALSVAFWLLVHTNNCLQTNYGDVVKFIAVPISRVNCLLVHVHYIV